MRDDIASNITRSYTIGRTSYNGTTSVHKARTVNLSEARRMCPGAVEFYMNQTNPAIHPVKLTDCKKLPRSFTLIYHYHWVFGQCRDSSSFCRVTIQVPSNMVVRAHIQRMIAPGAPGDVRPSGPASYWRLTVYKNVTCIYCNDKELRFSVRRHARFQYLSATNQLHLYYQNHPPVQVRFDAVQRKLDIRYTSDHSGFVTTWYKNAQGTLCDQLKAPANHVIMVSHDSLRLHRCSAFLILHYVRPGSGSRIVDKLHKHHYKFVKVYRTPQIDVCVQTTVAKLLLRSCFKLLFSFHHEHSVPQRLSSGLFNCSVDEYRRFQQHVDCNMQVDCEDGRDETGLCPYSSPACGGWISAQRKCYWLFRFESARTFPRKYQCRALGYELASMKTQQELDSAVTLITGTGSTACFGLTCGLASKRHMYATVFMWSDHTAMYNADHIKLRRNDCDRRGYEICFHNKLEIDAIFDDCGDVLCEKSANQADVFESKSVTFSLGQKARFTSQQIRQNVVICPKGHMTHAFLSCDPKSHCGQAKCHFSKWTRAVVEVISATHHSVDTVATYSCSSVDTELSYSLLCDFRQDCADNSDESFCHHPACTQFTCTSGQCVAMDKRCDLQMDCLDDSDEKGCPESSEPDLTDNKLYFNWTKSYVINFDGRGYFTQRAINLTAPCPETHYRCTKEWFYCLPVYTRCNEVFDCVFHEDERDCESWTCPGLYRCRDSTVCVHTDHMCDGWPQCPQHDDEWLCHMTCPAQCLCQGHALLCSRPFSAHLFPQLRYLDASRSGMTPSDLISNTYIVRLSLVQCSIRFLSHMKFPNLQFLDVSSNEIKSVVMNVFTVLQNLQILILKGNPLTSVTVNPSNTRQSLLEKIDLSGNHLTVLDSSMFSHTPGIIFINISHSATRSIRSHFLQKAPRLREIDIRGTIIDDFPSDLFLGQTDLTSVYASDYRFCCDEVLPSIAPKPRCLAPEHYLSSCDDMIRSEVYRLNFWVVAVLATLGNMVCFVCHCVKTCVTIPYGGAVVVFMASLQCADFCMGLYATVVTAAQQTFNGEYHHYENRWKEGVACDVAGFLSLLSSEVSMVMILLLSLDHFTALCFPLSMYRFSHRSAAVTCGVTWLVGILLASMSLLPLPVHFGRYGQTALCSLMVRDRRHPDRHVGFLHTIFSFNTLICIMVCVIQIAVFRARPRNQVLIDPEKNPVSASVDLLMRIAVTHVARWISVIATHILTSAGGVGQGVEVFMAVMVLPLSSAVSPLMCLWHAVAYRRRQIQQERLLHVLKSRRKCASDLSATH